MRAGIIALIALPATPALAEPAPFEASGFIGVSNLGGRDSGLGDATPAEQRPQTAPAFGGRLTFVPVRSTLSLGGELEAFYAPATTGSAPPRPAADAPVLAYRALLFVRVGTGWFQPFVEGGVGGATITTSSQFVARDTDRLLLWGAGVKFAMADGWQLRADARQGWTEGRDAGSTTTTYEVLLGIGKTFGARGARPAPVERMLDMTTSVTVSLTDTDEDGVPDTTDRCPHERGTDHGCPVPDPDPDPDRDRIVGAADRCPTRAEDYDNFEDTDGCPDADNDGDGFADAIDECPLEPETKNGIDDHDGCPDAMPAALASALDEASKVAFEPTRPRMVAATKPALDKLVAFLVANPRLRVTLVIHPDATGDAAKELATKRADVVMWHLVEQGVAKPQLQATLGSIGKGKTPALELLVSP